MHWTDVAAYAYLALGVVLMFGPVLWLVLSSFKTQGGLLEFPPSLLPFAAGRGGGAGFAATAAAVPRHAGRRLGARTRPGAAHRAHRPDGRSRTIPRSSSASPIDKRVPVRESRSPPRTTASRCSVSPFCVSWAIRCSSRSSRRLITLLINSMAAYALVDLRVSRQERGDAARHRHADDPDHHHPGAGLSGDHRARPRQLAVGGDPAGRGDADRRVPAAPVHADPAARPDRGGAHGQGLGVADLLAHRDAADAAGAGGAGDLLGHVALERIPVAARGADQDRSLHAADRAQRLSGRTADPVALSAGDDGGDAGCRSRSSSSSCSASSPPASPRQE